MNSKTLLIGAVAVVAVLALVILAMPGDPGEQRSGLALSPDDREITGQGRRIYQANCASCHGTRLEGQANWSRPTPVRLPFEAGTVAGRAIGLVYAAALARYFAVIGA